MSFETAIHCDGCGDTIFVSRIVPKGRLEERARKNGWSIGKYHLCEECRKNRIKLKKDGWIK